MLALPTLLLAAAATAAAALSEPRSPAYLDGYGPLDQDLDLPYAFHHMASLSTRSPFTRPLKVEWRRAHARDFVSPSPDVRQRDGDGDSDGDHPDTDGPIHLNKHDILPPPGCTVERVVSLQRHGARYMPATGYGSSALAQKALDKFHVALANLTDAQLADPRFGVLRNLTTPVGNGDLVPYGALQAYYSGVYDRQVYAHLAAGAKPFIRASGNYGNQSAVPSDRVLWTARWWSLGFSGAPFVNHTLDSAARVRDPTLPPIDVVFSEKKGINNTMDPSTCPHMSDDDHSDAILATYQNNTIMPTTGARILRHIAPAKLDLSPDDVSALMETCSYNSFLPANVTAGARSIEWATSPVCDLFTPADWRRYNYAQSLDFYYYQGIGNSASRGAYQGYLRELYARLNQSALPLEPVLTLNTTVAATGGFPVGGADAPRFYMDATHDANIAAIQLIFGLWDGPPLSDAKDAQLNSTTPFDAARAVPYQTKTAFETITCPGRDTQYLRVRTNEVPYPARKQKWCPLTHDEQHDVPAHLLQAGLCPLPAVLRGLEWVNGDGAWNTCFLNGTRPTDV